jgi:D-hexose-6-phosphate mutarotase
MDILIGVIGVVIAWLTYHKTFNSTPDTTEERNNLLGVFKVTQKLHLEVQSLIQKYIDENNGANHELYPNITFQHYLNVAKEEFEKGLSDKVYDDLRNNKDYTKSNIATFQNMIDIQHNALFQFRSQLLFLNKT